jgi:hypothetical protein
MSFVSLLEPYEYSPIQDDNSIRLLRVQKSDNTHSPLNCELFEAYPDGNIPYEAISYAWGGQTPDRYIVCEGRKLLVTKNCEDTLRQFRLEVADRILWIDGVCINQSSEAVLERNKQVALMRKVYSCAEQSLVWLGDIDVLIPLSKRSSVRAALKWLVQLSEVNCMDDEAREQELVKLAEQGNVAG